MRVQRRAHRDINEHRESRTAFSIVTFEHTLGCPNITVPQWLAVVAMVKGKAKGVLRTLRNRLQHGFVNRVTGATRKQQNTVANVVKPNSGWWTRICNPQIHKLLRSKRPLRKCVRISTRRSTSSRREMHKKAKGTGDSPKDGRAKGGGKGGGQRWWQGKGC